MIVRSARQADLECIVRLARDLAAHVGDPDPGPDTTRHCQAAFGDGAFCELLVAETDAGIVGFAAFSQRFELHTACKSAWLSDLVVARDHRRGKVGKHLLEGVKTRAAELGARKIVFDVWVQNLGALTFYRRQQAARVPEVDIYEIDLSET